MYLLAKLSWTGGAMLMNLPDDPDEPKAVAAARNAYLRRSIKGVVAEICPGNNFCSGWAAAHSGKPAYCGPHCDEAYSAAALAEEKLAPRQGAAQQQRWLQLHSDEASWFSQSRHESLSDSGHHVQNDRPDAVIRTAGEMVAAVPSRNQPKSIESGRIGNIGLLNVERGRSAPPWSWRLFACR